MKRLFIMIMLAIFSLQMSAQTSGGMIKRGAAQKKSSSTIRKKTPHRRKTTTARKKQIQNNQEEADGTREYKLGLAQIDKENYEKAAYWLKQAADVEHPFAQYFLGMMYLNGIGVEEDKDKAHELFEEASPVIYYIANMYAEGDQALWMLDKVCEMNHSPYNAWAYCYRGYLYLYGKKGVATNNYKAFEDLKKGAELGSKSAMYMLARCYENEWGTTRNYNLSAQWRRQSGYTSMPSLEFSNDNDDIDTSSRGGYYEETGTLSGEEWRYWGNYKNGKHDGLGTLIWGSDGEYYYGEFKEGYRTGIGVYHWPDGSYYTGEFLRNQRSGEGTYYYADHTYKKGIWKDNKIQTVKETGKW